MFRSISLHVQVVALLAIAISPIGAVGIWQALHTARETARLNEVELINRTRLAAEEERAALTAAFGAAHGLSVAISLNDRDRSSCSILLRQFVESDPRYVFSGALDADGGITCSSSKDGQVPESILALSEGLKAEEPRRRVRLYKRGLSLDTVTLTVLHPIYRDGRLAATFVLSMPASLIHAVARSTDEEAGFRLGLLDNDGRIFAEDTDQLGDANWTPQDAALRLDAQFSEQVVTNISRAGEARSYAVVPIIPGDIYALGSWRHRDLSESASTRLWNAVLFPASMWALALGVSYFAVYRLAVRHITYLRRILRAFQGGRRNVRAMKLEMASSELSELGQAFDQMAETIESDEQELRRGIDEKNTLLKEVHHRVKNNLQLVISMMNMQLRKLQSADVKEAIARLQERVMGLAAVHQQLYQATDLTAVRCDELLTEIAKNIIETTEASAGVRVDFDMTPILLGPDQAIPLSLFATECVMNAVKHSGDTGGKVEMSLTEVEDGKIRLSVANTVSSSVVKESLNTGIGSQLIEAFSKQLNGEVETDWSDTRHRISLTFSPSGFQ